MEDPPHYIGTCEGYLEIPVGKVVEVDIGIADVNLLWYVRKGQTLTIEWWRDSEPIRTIKDIIGPHFLTTPIFTPNMRMWVTGEGDYNTSLYWSPSFKT